MLCLQRPAVEFVILDLEDFKWEANANRHEQIAWWSEEDCVQHQKKVLS